MQNEMPVGMRISILSRAFRKKMDVMLQEQDLTGVQFGVLGALAHLEKTGMEEVNQKDLEQITRVTHPTMTDLIKRLEKKELLHCETSSRDRRFKRISATEKARGLMQSVRAVEDDTFAWLCRGLRQEQIEQFLAITDVMLQNACGILQGEGSDEKP